MKQSPTVCPRRLHVYSLKPEQSTLICGTVQGFGLGVWEKKTKICIFHLVTGTLRRTSFLRHFCWSCKSPLRLTESRWFVFRNGGGGGLTREMPCCGRKEVQLETTSWRENCYTAIHLRLCESLSGENHASSIIWQVLWDFHFDTSARRGWGQGREAERSLGFFGRLHNIS